MAKSLVEIEGFNVLNAKIRALKDDKTKKKEMLKILGQVANPTVKAARNEAPISNRPHLISGKRTRKLIQPGNLKKSIGKIRGKKGLGKENAVLYVGPRSKGRKNDGWYGMFVAHGTKHQEANPFMDRAYKQTKGKVTAEAEAKTAKYIQKQIDKLSN